MATVTTGTGAISSEFPAAFYDRLLLERLLPNLLHLRYGLKKNLPKNNGKVIQVRRWERMTAVTSALTEGTVPSESSFSITGITATIAQHGDFVKFTDLVEWTGLDDVLTELAELLGEAAGDSLDQIVRAVVTAGTSVTYANGSARTDVNTAASATLLRKARRELKGNNAKPIMGADYVAVVHPDVAYDLMADSKFEAKGQYVTANNVIETGELGRIYSIRLMESSNARIVTDGGGAKGSMTSTTGTNADVYLTVVFGKDAYMVVDLEGEGSDAVKTIFKPKGSAGTADPLDQLQTAGWKANFISKIVNDNAMTRLESAATA